jgi:putative FmdB family regulatory protein
MPTYEYRCPAGHEFERFFRTISSAEAKLPCPQCGAVGERFMSAGAGLVFKGSGFYLTDYGKNAHATRGETRPSPGSDSARDGTSADSAAENKSTPAKPGESSSPAPAAGDGGGGSGDANKAGAGVESKPAAVKPDAKGDTKRRTKGEG